MRRRKLLPGLFLWTAVAGLVAATQATGVLDRLEWLAYDARVATLRSERAASPEVAVILVDEASLRALDPLVGRWPWPRSLFADLLEFLALGEPRAVVFDVLFTERQGGQIGEPGALDPDDRRLVNATAQVGTVYHAAQFLRDRADEGSGGLLNRPLPPEAARRFALASDLAAPLAGNRRSPPNDNYYLPISELWQAARGIGAVDLEPDRDGVFRRAPLVRGYQGQWFPSLALAPVIGTGHGAPDWPTRLPPADADGTYLINLYGRYDTYSISGVFASLQRLREGEVDGLLVHPDEFRDRIVFVGASAVGVGDVKPTPVSPKTPGVFLHAAVASNLLLADYLTPAPVGLAFAAALLLAGAAVVVVLGTPHLFGQLAGPAVLGAAYTAWNFWRFAHDQVWPLVVPLAALAVAGSLSGTYTAFTEGRDRRRVRRMFSQYVSPAVLAEVVDKYRDHLSTGLATKERLTVLFSDIRDFTAISEALPPAEVVDLLNLYFAEMAEAVFEHQGTIDKFIGDALMCFWGAPIRVADHEARAVASALAMLRRLPAVNGRLREKGYPPVRIGVGITTGEVVLGNVGSERKLDYTVIGDEVNLASRLEGLTKAYRTPILLSESTMHSLKGRIPCAPVDLVRVKGKRRPIRAYRPLVEPAATLPAGADAFRLSAEIEAAFDAYLARRWEEALERHPPLPGDPVWEAFCDRCEGHRHREPPPDWDGVRAFEVK